MNERRNESHGSDSAAPASGGVSRWLDRLVLLRPGEGTTVLLCAAYFFCILFSNFLLRPIRDEFGIRGELSDLPWLWTGTTAATLLVAPIFAWLVSRFPRRLFLPGTYLFFALNLGVFYALLLVLPTEAHKNIGYAFYIWHSVFNLLAVSVFWGFMADLWGTEESKRVFGALAVGGTLGAIAGSAAAATLAKTLSNTAHVLPLSGFMILSAAGLVWVLARRLMKSPSGERGRSEPSRNPWAGFALLARSPYLLAMALYMLLFTVTSTLLYFEQARIVKETFADSASRTAAFAQVDLATNILTLVTQAFLTGRVVRRAGVVVGLCVVPIVSILGFAALWAAPELGWPIFVTFAVVSALRRSMHHAMDRPSREILYTPLGPDEKYKAKSFIDTFIYRGGDLLGAWANMIKGFATTVEVAAISLGAVAIGTGVYLAKQHAKVVAARERRG